MIIHAWSKGSRICDYANELNLSANSLGQHFIHLREVCSMQILSMDLRMGGPGVVIEIDESQFRHKPKHHRGRGPVSTVWVFGMVDTSTSPSIGIMKVVPDRSAATLLPIIYDNIRPGISSIAINGQHTHDYVQTPSTIIALLTISTSIQ